MLGIQAPHKSKVVKSISVWLFFRAERLHSDLFYFLGDASKSYNDHFSMELQKVSKEGNSGSVLGPTILIFHETVHTDVLTSSAAASLSDSRNGLSGSRWEDCSQILESQRFLVLGEVSFCVRTLPDCYRNGARSYYYIVYYLFRLGLIR